MALKVVAAGDERCDIHNARKPAKYICKDCLDELGVDDKRVVRGGGPIRRARRLFRRGPSRQASLTLRNLRSRPRRTALIGVGAVLAITAIVVVVVLASGGRGGQTRAGPPTVEEVVNALDLSPDPSGTGWITLDGACSVVSIQVGTPPTTQANPTSEATNEDRTVRAVVVESFSLSQTACVNRINAALREHF